MKRLLFVAGLALSVSSALGAEFSTAGWYRLEVFPSLEIVAGPYANEKACAKTIAADEDHVHRCVTLAKKGDEVDRAIEIFGEAVKQNPHDSSSMNIRGLLYQRKGEWRAARDEFERAMKASPDDFWPYVFRGDLFKEMGDREHAIEDYVQVLARHPGDQSLVQTLKNKIKELGGAP